MFTFSNRRLLPLLLGFILGLFGVFAEPACVSADPVSYVRDIKPLLKNKCYACHGRVKQEAGLRLDAGQLVLLGGDDG